METESKLVSNELLSNSRSLVKNLSEIQARKNYKKIGIELIENKKNYGDSVKNGGSETQPGTSNLIITIEAETQQHAEEHAQELADQGCICTSTGPTSVECDCTDVM